MPRVRYSRLVAAGILVSLLVFYCGSTFVGKSAITPPSTSTAFSHADESLPRLSQSSAASASSAPDSSSATAHPTSTPSNDVHSNFRSTDETDDQRGINLPDGPQTPFLTVATMIKNERPWIREWIEFYLMMGVDHFLIYDDSSNDRPREILGHYIDAGLLTHIIWPNTTHPQWSQVPDDADRTDKVRGTWFNQSLRDCLEGDWMHRKQPCQLSAFTDAILRAKERGSRWLAVLDIDEYIFPRRGSGFENLVDLLKENHDETDHLIIQGVKFGTEGHVEYPARRKPGDELHALLTESYTMRAQLNDNAHFPIESLREGGGSYLEHADSQDLILQYTGVQKAFANPEKVLTSMLDSFSPLESQWNEETISNDDFVWKFNHYAYPSEADTEMKTAMWSDLYFTPQIFEFFAKVKDTEIMYYVPQLRRRLLRSIRENKPPRPDDWSAPHLAFESKLPNKVL